MSSSGTPSSRPRSTSSRSGSRLAPATAAGSGAAVTDLRRIPEPQSRKQEFLYVKNLAAPWSGIDDTQQRASIRMNFDSNDFPFVWLFLTYGGWRGYYTAVLEPCTNMPKCLAEALRQGQSARFDPGKLQIWSETVRVAICGLQRRRP